MAIQFNSHELTSRLLAPGSGHPQLIQGFSFSNPVCTTIFSSSPTAFLRDALSLQVPLRDVGGIRVGAGRPIIDSDRQLAAGQLVFNKERPAIKAVAGRRPLQPGERFCAATIDYLISEMGGLGSEKYPPLAGISEKTWQRRQPLHRRKNESR